MKKNLFCLHQVFVYLFIGLLVYWFIPQHVAAAGEFQADYDVVYDIAPEGMTTVTQTITLTNKLSNLYAKEYVVVIDSDNLANIIAYEKRGVIHPKITKNNGKTEIVVPFSDHVVGLEKSHHFTLRYENRDFVQKVGSIWEVTIPGVAEDPDLGSYIVAVNAPASFGPLAYMWPQPKQNNRWTKDQLIKGGISAAYGEMQVFALTLSYHLENSALTTQSQDVALPPDTPFQKVTLQSLTPNPTTIARDADGNWLARYQLLAGQKLDIEARVLVGITLHPRDSFGPEQIDSSQYVAPSVYWQTNDPFIVSLAQQYRTPREIYDYVASNLVYDYNQVNLKPNRKGAIEALKNPTQALCREFTDAFIAIARAAGIPAREVVGFAYTTNPRLRPLSLVADVLHAWPEYYDSQKQLWIPIDPTWANTTRGINYFDKLDFNHIVFAIHGLSPDYPYPAGFYRKNGKVGKDVLVDFGDPKSVMPTGKVLTRIEIPDTILGGFPVSGTIVVENTSGASLENVHILATASPFDFSAEKNEATIPPFSSVTIPVSFRAGTVISRAKGELSVVVNDELTRKEFTVLPLYLPILAVIATLGVLAAAIRILWRKR